LPVPDADGGVQTLLDGWVRDGLATREEGRVRLTTAGWLVLDGLAVDLDRAYDHSASA
jgi:hypothetical protein